jgi:serine/threonine-protein kinase
MVLLIAVAIVGAVTRHPDFIWVLFGLALAFGGVILMLSLFGSSAPSAKPVSPTGQPAASPAGNFAASSSPESAYELLDAIGSGQMGTVHRGRHRLLARPVAIKTIKPGNVDHEDLARFKREARAIAGLYSPHTVAVYDFGTRSDGSLYYVMELLAGIDLQRFIQQHGAMPPERAVYVLRQICHSLEEAHSVGLVHRDLKPSNVMLCKYGLDADFVKVVDFGLVKGAGAASGAATVEINLTKEHVVLGTPAYLAPESLKGSSKVMASADVYALGCIAFWLLTARLVFDYDQPLRMVGAHSTEAPSPPSRFAPGVPRELDAIVLRCLEKQPERRPTASELFNTLEHLRFERAWTSEDARRWWQRQSPPAA